MVLLLRVRETDNGDGRHVVALQGRMYSMSQRHTKVMGLMEELHLACFHNSSIKTHK
jgi:hypothetical protein